MECGAAYEEESLMSFLTKIFSKKDKREEDDEKEKRRIQELIQFLESIAETNDTQEYQRYVEGMAHWMTKIEQIDSARAKGIAEYGNAQLEYIKLKRSEKIVNEYGQAITEASEQNKRLVENLNADSMKKILQEKGADYYRLMGKFDIHSLPYSKEIIADAIEFLLQHSQYEPDPYVGTLQRGLMYLDDFIDFSAIES